MVAAVSVVVVVVCLPTWSLTATHGIETIFTYSSKNSLIIFAGQMRTAFVVLNMLPAGESKDFGPW